MTIEPQLMSITKLAYRLHYNLAPFFILRCFFHKRSTNKETPTKRAAISLKPLRFLGQTGRTDTQRYTWAVTKRPATTQ